MVRTHETSYRDEFDLNVAIDVRFFTRHGEVVDYTVVLLVEDRAEWHAVRVYDNAHQINDMHRYNREGEKQPAETFHEGSASEALQRAIEAIRTGYSEMTESWRR
ncbi:MAG: hypothetical protein WA484_15645 [Solirubrobacteraceae bacterium]